MAKSYAQVNGHQVIDWRRELQLLIDTKESKVKESKVDLNLASDWETCYVGQQSVMIERDFATPIDDILEDIGAKFSKAVEEGNFEEALNIMEMIDIRCEYLLKLKQDEIIKEISITELKLKELKLSLKNF
jgi:hypothetical protein